MRQRTRDRELPTYGSRARICFRVFFGLWVLVWTASFFVDRSHAMTLASNALMLLGLLSGVIWLVAETRSGYGEGRRGR